MCDYNQMRSSGMLPSGIIDHVSSLSNHLGELIENSEYSDIALVVEQRRFPAHKVILAARSEYFRSVNLINLISIKKCPLVSINRNYL